MVNYLYDSGKTLITKIKESIIPEDMLAIWYLGQEGFLLKANGKYVLTDPYLSDYVDRNCSTEKVVWKRNYPTPVQPALLSFVNYILCSHVHNDHTDPDTLTAICGKNKSVKIIAPAPIAETIISYGIDKSVVIPARAFVQILLDAV